MTRYEVIQKKGLIISNLKLRTVIERAEREGAGRGAEVFWVLHNKF